MSTLFEIPVTGDSEAFKVRLSGVDYTLTLKWNDFAGVWMMDLANAETGAYLLASIPIVSGINLLDGLEYLGIPGGIFANTDGNLDADPTFENFGTESHLYYYTDVPNG